MRKKKVAFFFVCDYLLPSIVGKCRFRKFAHQMKISDFVTRSDEAFLYLILENIWERAMDMVDNGISTHKESNVKTKYTERGASAKAYNGWTDEGLIQYNVLMAQVRKNRKQYKGVEDMYLQHRQEMMGLNQTDVNNNGDGIGDGKGGKQPILTTNDLFGDSESNKENSDEEEEQSLPSDDDESERQQQDEYEKENDEHDEVLDGDADDDNDDTGTNSEEDEEEKDQLSILADKVVLDLQKK